jgi:hypothetical protein
MMTSEDEDASRREVSFFWTLVISTLMEFLFLLIWCACQWALDQAADYFRIRGYNSWVLWLMQIIFAISTFSVIVYSAARNIRKIINRLTDRHADR